MSVVCPLKSFVSDVRKSVVVVFGGFGGVVVLVGFRVLIVLGAGFVCV